MYRRYSGVIAAVFPINSKSHAMLTTDPHKMRAPENVDMQTTLVVSAPCICIFKILYFFKYLFLIASSTTPAKFSRRHTEG